jgi:hypothetical protein
MSRLTCEHTATTPDGERIFAVEARLDSYGITTGGMRESELRAVVEVLGRKGLGRDYDVIVAALDG